MSFEIDIAPHLPVVEITPGSVDFSRLDFARIIENVTGEYDIRFIINERRFSYYPSSVLTVLNDLHLELDLFRLRKPHDVTLSGYTILRVRFEDRSAIFVDPVEELHGDVNRATCGDAIASDVEQKLQSAVRNVWSVVAWANSTPSMEAR